MGHRLKEVIFSLTNRCNLRCLMCQIPLEAAPELSTEEAKRLIVDLLDFHPESIVFSGGEPLLREDIYELIAFATAHKLNTCLTSNGTLISEAVAKKLSSSGVGVVNISIDGPEEVHDALRGKGNFKKALQALKHLTSARVETTLATMVCRLNYTWLAFIMELAHSYGVTTVKFQPFSDIFLMQKEENERFFILSSELQDAQASIQKVLELSSRYKISTNPPGYLKRVPVYLCGKSEEIITPSCEALFSSCPISSEGNVYLCWRVSEPVLGNVLQKSIHKIWDTPAHNLLRKNALSRRCKGCLMSCYDYNFKDTNPVAVLYEKTKSAGKTGFTRREYFRFYQYLRYMIQKTARKFGRLITIAETPSEEPDALLRKISHAKVLLKERLRSLKKK